jgi:hypothetical protein
VKIENLHMSRYRLLYRFLYRFPMSISRSLGSYQHHRKLEASHRMMRAMGQSRRRCSENISILFEGDGFDDGERVAFMLPIDYEQNLCLWLSSAQFKVHVRNQPIQPKFGVHLWLGDKRLKPNFGWIGWLPRRRSQLC